MACEADLTLLGLAANDHLGFAVGSLGPDGHADWNGDGAPDLLIGAYQKLDVPRPGERPAGSVTVALSPWTWETREPRPRDRTLLRVEGELGSRLGRSVAWIGDLDGDGRSDFAAGDIRGPRAPTANGAWTQRGLVYVFLSGDAETGLAGAEGSGRFAAARASVIVAGEAASHRFGHSLAGVGDVDGDGTPDVLVGAPGRLAAADFGGKAYVLSGARLLDAAAAPGPAQPASANALAIWSRAGEEPLDAFGYTVANVGMGAFAVGAVELTFDPSKGLAPERSLVTNGPGYVVVVDRFADEEDGTGGVLRERRLAGETDGAWFGFALGGGDLDGDGTAELLVGSPGWSGDAHAESMERAERTGRARAFALEDLAQRAEVRGTARFQMLGWSVGGYGPAPGAEGSAPDLWAVGEFGYARPPQEGAAPCPDVVTDRPIPQAGRLRLFAGTDTGAPLLTVVGERNADSAGAVFAYLGDLDGSGGTDVVLSVFRWDQPAPKNDVGKVCVFRDPW